MKTLGTFLIIILVNLSGYLYSQNSYSLKDAFENGLVEITFSSTETNKFLHVLVEKIGSAPLMIKCSPQELFKFTNNNKNLHNPDFEMILSPAIQNEIDLSNFSKGYLIMQQKGPNFYTYLKIKINKVGVNKYQISYIDGKMSFTVGNTEKIISNNQIYIENGNLLIEEFNGNRSGVIKIDRKFNNNGLISRKLDFSNTAIGEEYGSLGTDNWFDFSKPPNVNNQTYVVDTLKKSKVLRLKESPNYYINEAGQLLGLETKNTSVKIVEDSGNADVYIENKTKQNQIPVNHRFPHKKAIAIEMNYMVGTNLIGGDVEEIVKNEDSFLQSLVLVWQETQNGQVVSSTPIDEYDYDEGVYIGGFRVCYFLSNTFALGGNFRFYNYAQSLKAGKNEGDGSLIRINYFGPSFSYLFFHKNRIGFSLKTDISLVSGKFETIPALLELNDENIFDDIAGLPSLIESRNKTTSITGFQLNSGLSFNYFVARWFNIDAGLHLSYFSGEVKDILWLNTSKSYKSFTPGFYFGMNFLLKNNFN